jgi:flagellar biosynthesis protein FliR
LTGPPAELAGFLLILARLLPLALVAPWLAGSAGPLRAPVVLRVVVALVAALVLAPLAFPRALPAFAVAWLVPALLKEVAVGTGLAVASALAFLGVSAGGRLAGLSLSGDALPGLARDMGTLYGLLALLVFGTIGGYGLFWRALAASYQAFPLYADLGTNDFGGLLAKALLAGERALVIALALAAPLVVARLLCECVVALMARFALGAEALALSAPMRLLVGLAVLAWAAYLAAPFLARELLRVFD